jgi:hypothetical protein
LIVGLWLGSASPSLANDADGKADRLSPPSYVSVEGGVAFNASDDNLAFDPADDKLGDLGALAPGDDGWQARVEYGRSLDPVWDYRIGAGLIVLGDDAASSDVEYDLPDVLGFPDSILATTSAAQDLNIGLVDLDVGFRPEIASGMDVRLFGGLRGLAASSDSEWSDKLGIFPGSVEGGFEDETWAVGPRIGVDLFVPLESERGIGLVGSLSGAALFGNRSTDYSSFSGGIMGPSGPEISDSFSESVTIWNVDAMAGLSVPLTNDGASVTLGYRAQSFQNLVTERSNVRSDGTYSDGGDGDVLIHGPFVKLTIPLS